MLGHQEEKRKDGRPWFCVLTKLAQNISIKQNETQEGRIQERAGPHISSQKMGPIMQAWSWG